MVPLVAALWWAGTAAAQTARSAAPAAGQGASPAPANKKEPRPIPADAPVYARQGTWFGVGLGAGAASLACRICDGEQGSRGTSGYLRVGTTLNGRLLLGAEANAWMRSDQTGNQRLIALTGNGYWYPNPRHGYYFKGGFGISAYKQWVDDENNDELTTGLAGGGFTGHVGTGYEIRVNPRMSFVPYLNLVASAGGSLYTERDDGTSYERNRLPNKANVVLLQLGLGVTWH
jgi:hypothetical protein